MVDRWKAFNWHVLEINGHNVRQIVEALDHAEEIHSQPTIIIAHTTKGKGVSYMENDSRWHGAVPKPELYEQALKELQKEEV
jgi:transketolase